VIVKYQIVGFRGIRGELVMAQCKGAGLPCNKEGQNMFQGEHYCPPCYKKVKKQGVSKEIRKNVLWRIDGPLGVFDDEGNLVSGKSPSLATQQKFSTIPKSGQIKLTSDRVPRKCSGIHPHCSICGKCHRNVRTHWIGH
jgi:hypothetical protein